MSRSATKIPISVAESPPQSFSHLERIYPSAPEVTAQTCSPSPAQVGQSFCPLPDVSKGKIKAVLHLIFLLPAWGLITHLVWAEPSYHHAESRSINFQLLIIRLDRSFKASVDSLQLTYSCQLENHLKMGFQFTSDSLAVRVSLSESEKLPWKGRAGEGPRGGFSSELT